MSCLGNAEFLYWVEKIGGKNFGDVQNASTHITHMYETHRSQQQIEVGIDRNNGNSNKID